MRLFNVLSGIIYGFLMVTSALLSNGLVTYLLSIPLVVNRWKVVVLEAILITVSTVLLLITGRIYFYPFTLRGMTFLNLFLIASTRLDKSSLVDLAGERGVPVVVGLTYYPYLTSTARELLFYAKARRKSPLSISLPLVVVLVRTAYDLWNSYVIKLSGEFKRGHLKLGVHDYLLVLTGVVGLFLSLVMRF